ncbi:MAG: YihY family inner membrane protein [Pseudomonadota bacterium]
MAQPHEAETVRGIDVDDSDGKANASWDTNAEDDWEGEQDRSRADAPDPNAVDQPPVGGARGILDWVGFPIYVARRFGRDACPSVAGSLSFTALLALVPVLVIGLAMFSAFPAFGDVRTAIVGTLFSTFLPSMSDAIYDQISTFMDNAGRTTGFGIIGLALTAILLINTIQTAFDRIWRGSARRKALARLPVYWALITLGPILFGLSISLSSHLFRAAQDVNGYGASEAVAFGVRAAPYFLQAAGFTLVYWLLPTRPVRLSDAAVQ